MPYRLPDAKNISMADPPFFTVFTPTYNRAHTIHRVFNSLRAQTFRDFEWLIIDDGSTDDTKRLISEWANSADFNVRYVKQVHAGKHVAHNRALVEAKGSLFVILDSDDALVPSALATLARLWNSIPESERHAFCSIGTRCCDQDGNIIGDRFPTEPFDADLREITYRRRIRGEKFIVWVTEIMRRYPFPEIAGTQFIPEGLVCYDIAKSFKGRWSNEAIRIYYVDDRGTGATLTKRRDLTENARGRLCFYIWALNNDLGYFFNSPLPFLKAAVLLPILSWSSNGVSFKGSLMSVHKFRARLLVLLMLPVSTLLFIFEKCKGRARHFWQLKCASSR